MKSMAAVAMATRTSVQDRTRRWMKGSTKRMMNVAAAKEARMMPMVVADRPMATPKIGTTNRCVSQAPDRMVLTIRMRRSAGTASNSVTRRRSASLAPASCESTARNW